MGPVVCEVSDMWRVSGMWGSVVCGECGVSGMLWSVLCGGSGMGYLRSVVYLGSVVYLRAVVLLRSVLYLRSVGCEINGEGRQ